MAPWLVEQATGTTGQIIAIDVRPLLAIAIMVGAAAWGAVALWRRTPALPVPLPRVAPVVIVGVLGGAAVVALMFLRARDTLRAWSDLQPYALALGALTAAQCGLFLAAALRFTVRPSRAAVRPLVGVAGATIVTVASGVPYGSELARAAPFEIDAPPPRRVHVGESELRPILVATATEGFFGQDRYPIVHEQTFWTLDATRLDGSRPGKITVPLTVSRRFLRMRRPVEIEVGADIPNPALPLAVGNRWTYRVTDHASTVRTFGADTASETDRGTLVIEVLREARQDGLRQLEVSVRRSEAGTADRGQRTWLYGWGGATYAGEVVAPAGAAWRGLPEAPRRPRRIPSGPALPVFVIDADRTCSLGLIPGFSCKCGKPPRGPDGLLECRRSHNTPAPISILEGLLFVVTLGTSGLSSGADSLELTEAISR